MKSLKILRNGMVRQLNGFSALTWCGCRCSVCISVCQGSLSVAPDLGYTPYGSGARDFASCAFNFFQIFVNIKKTKKDLCWTFVYIVWTCLNICYTFFLFSKHLCTCCVEFLNPFGTFQDAFGQIRKKTYFVYIHVYSLYKELAQTILWAGVTFLEI